MSDPPEGGGTSLRAERPRYGFEHSGEARPEPCEAQEVDQLPTLVQEITRLCQRDYILLATFLRALTR